MSEKGEITRLLHAYAGGNRAAFDELVPLIYDELRRIARNHLRRTRRSVTLDTNGLVHEAYLKLAGQKGMRVEDRGHFLAIAARAMRIIISRARARVAAKRGGGEIRVTFDEGRVAASEMEARVAPRPRPHARGAPRAGRETGAHRGVPLLRRSFRGRDRGSARGLAPDRQTQLDARPRLDPLGAHGPQGRVVGQFERNKNSGSRPIEWRDETPMGF